MGAAGAPPFGLILRLWLAVMVAAAVAAGLVAEVAAGHLRDRQAAVRGERMLHVARDLQGALEGVVGLGLTLEQAPRVQDMLERAQTDAEALSIEVFDPKGRILFGTDRSFLGDLVAERWMAAAGRASGGASGGASGAWTAEDPDALVIGVPVTDNLGAVVGTIAVRHAKVPRPSALALLAPEPEERLLLGGGVFLFAAVAFLTLSRLLSALGGELTAARKALARPEDAAGGPLAQAAASAARAVQTAAQAQDRALGEARRIDADAA